MKEGQRIERNKNHLDNVNEKYPWDNFGSGGSNSPGCVFSILRQDTELRNTPISDRCGRVYMSGWKVTLCSASVCECVIAGLCCVVLSVVDYTWKQKLCKCRPFIIYPVRHVWLCHLQKPSVLCSCYGATQAPVWMQLPFSWWRKPPLGSDWNLNIDVFQWTHSWPIILHGLC